MVFDYYKRLPANKQSVYRQSDAIIAVIAARCTTCACRTEQRRDTHPAGGLPSSGPPAGYEAPLAGRLVAFGA